MRCQMRLLLSLPGSLTQWRYVPGEHTEQGKQLSFPNEPHAKFLTWLRAIRLVPWWAKEGEAVGSVHQQEMMVSHCKSRNGGHETACHRNSAILASALPARSLPSTATVLDWHGSYTIAELCSWPYDSSSAWERTWAACKLRVLKRQSLTILALTYVCAYESHNGGATSMETN